MEKNKPLISVVMPAYNAQKYISSAIESILRKGNDFNKYKIEKLNNVENKVAKLLSEGKVVARLSGRMEWGARALGNRSILAHPQNLDVVMIINEQMKDRDFWIPFAPSILENKIRDDTVNPKNLDAYYMMATFDTTEKARKELKATMHRYDFTIRPQVVRKDFNQKYHKILKEFERITGLGEF